MADNTTTTVTDNTTNTATSDVQADTSLLNSTIEDDSEAAETTSAESTADAAATDDNTDADTETDKPEGDEAEEEKPKNAPEAYEFTAPEGVTLDPDAVAEFEPIARELDLTNEQAQKLVDIQAGLVRKQYEAWDKQVATWVTEVKTDKEIGGTETKKSLVNAQAAITKFGTPELKAALDSTKMGNHPELVRVFARIGKAMAEDSFVPADLPSGEQKSAADRLYGSKTKTD